MSLLFKNATIINSKFECLENAYLGIENGTIDYIGTSAPKKVYTEEKDMHSKILLPGFVNCHGHAAMVLLRNTENNLPLQQWLEHTFAVEDKMIENDFFVGTELAILEMLASGTTSFSDMYMYETAVAKAVEESGIKANLSRGFCGGFDNEDYKLSKRRKESFELFKNYNGSFDDRLRIDFSIHAEYTTTENFIKEWAQELKTVKGARMQVHLSETKKEHEQCLAKYGKTPTQLFNDNGVFDIPTSAAHCVWCSDDDLAILKSKNVGICHCPESNLKLGSGIANIPKMLDIGLTVGLGTDGASSNNNLNMVEEVHCASLIHKGIHKDAGLMTPSQCIKMATLNGALIQGRTDTGVLEVGKKADIVAINTDAPHLHPNLDSLAIVAYSAQASDVCMTMINGKILYENGEYKTLDKDKIFYEIEKAADRLYNR